MFAVDANSQQQIPTMFASVISTFLLILIWRKITKFSAQVDVVTVTPFTVLWDDLKQFVKVEPVNDD